MRSSQPRVKVRVKVKSSAPNSSATRSDVPEIPANRGTRLNWRPYSPKVKKKIIFRFPNREFERVPIFRVPGERGLSQRGLLRPRGLQVQGRLSRSRFVCFTSKRCEQKLVLEVNFSATPMNKYLASIRPSLFFVLRVRDNFMIKETIFANPPIHQTNIHVYYSP